jgi:hypothetical protein
MSLVRINIVAIFFMQNTMHIKREGGFNPAELLSSISHNHITVCQNGSHYASCRTFRYSMALHMT